MAQFQFPKLMALKSLQQRRYVLELAARGFEGETEAAKAAGYAGKAATERLRRNAKVQAAIEEQQALAERALESEYGPTRDRIVREIALLAFNSIGDVVSFDRKGVYLKPSKELAQETLAAISKVKDGTYGVELSMYDKGINLERLAKVLGYLQPDQPPPGGVTLVIGDPRASMK